MAPVVRDEILIESVHTNYKLTTFEDWRKTNQEVPRNSRSNRKGTQKFRPIRNKQSFKNEEKQTICSKKFGSKRNNTKAFQSYLRTKSKNRFFTKNFGLKEEELLWKWIRREKKSEKTRACFFGPKEKSKEFERKKNIQRFWHC